MPSLNRDFLTGQCIRGQLIQQRHIQHRMLYPKFCGNLPRMLGVLVWDIVQANVTVALQVLGPERKIRPGFIWVPLDIDNIHGIAALTSIITLTPGTVSSALSDDRRHLLVHVLNLDDADDVIRQIKTRYEAPLMEIFP